jgi:heat shock protein HslJ
MPPLRLSPLLAALALSACASAPAERPPRVPATPPGWLDGTAWSLAELRGEPAPFLASIRFEGDQLKGTAACNRYFGGFVQKGDAVEISAVAASRMACPQADAEDRYFSSLTDAARVDIAAGRLTIYGVDGAALMAFTGG